MSWTFNPSYRFLLQKRDPVSRKISTWSLTTLVNTQALLVTQAGVGQLTATFADPGQSIMRNAQPHAMDVVQLQLNNRYGRWANAWTGFVDEVHHIFDPAQGDLVTFNCTSPYKLWEITRETANQTQNLTVSYAVNVSGSTVLKYSAQAVGYPLIDSKGKPMLIVDPTADVGTGPWGQVAQQFFTDPDQQTWSAIIQALIGDSGLEFFFDENGRGIYRQFGYLGTPGIYNQNGLPLKAGYRRVDPDEILSADIVESDKGLITEVQVRWGNQPVYQLAGNWPPSGSAVRTSMENQLRQRQYIAYAPWIQTGNAQSAAQYLAQVIWQQLASNAMHALITVPADPFIRIGSVIQVPSLRTVQSGAKVVQSHDLFYVSSITYQLTWAGTWVMTLGLQYGRKDNQSFPYVGGIAAPALTQDIISAMATSSTIITFSSDNPLLVTTPLTVVANTKLAKNEVALDADYLVNWPAGSTIQINDLKTGKPIGPHSSSDYTVVSTPAASGTIQIQSNPTKATKATITIVSQSSDGSDLSSGGGDTSSPTFNNSPAVTYTPYKDKFPIYPISGQSPDHLNQEFGPGTVDQIPYNYSGHHYDQFHNGIDIYALSGTPVHSATDGTVYFAGNVTGATLGRFGSGWWGFGNLVIVQSGGLYLWYAHLSNINVSAGQSVTHGDVIAESGFSGNVSPAGPNGAHLHFGVLDSAYTGDYSYGEFIDPRIFYGFPGVALPTN